MPESWYIPIGRLEPAPGEALSGEPLARRVDLAAGAAGVALRPEGRAWRLEAGGLSVPLRPAGGSLICATAGRSGPICPAAAERTVDGLPVGPVLAALGRLGAALGMALSPAAWLTEPEPAAPWERFDASPWSVCWRMGGGEDYMMDFRLFWVALSAEERASYLDRHRAPPEWREAWARWDRARG